MLTGPKVQPFTGDKAEFIEKIRRALYLGKIVSYAQGFSQLKAASNENNWDLNYGEIAKIFRAGCIIRAQFLQKLLMLMQKTQISLTCCWHRTSSKLLMNTSKRCVMWCLMRYKTVSQRQHSLLRLTITTATVQPCCLLT